MVDKYPLDPQVKNDNPLNKDLGDFEERMTCVLSITGHFATVSMAASVPPRQCSLGRPLRTTPRERGLGEDESSNVEETDVDDVDIGEVKRTIGEGVEEVVRGENRGR